MHGFQEVREVEGIAQTPTGRSYVMVPKDEAERQQELGWCLEADESASMLERTLEEALSEEHLYVPADVWRKRMGDQAD